VLFSIHCPHSNVQQNPTLMSVEDGHARRSIRVLVFIECMNPAFYVSVEAGECGSRGALGRGPLHSLDKEHAHDKPVSEEESSLP
jgi:hypothetical protein